MGIDIIPEKYRTLFTKNEKKDLKLQHILFAEYFDLFIQSIPFFKYFTSQINHKTRKPETPLNRTYTCAISKYRKEKSTFSITYTMDRNKKGLLEITQDYSEHLKNLGDTGKKLAKRVQQLSQKEEEILWGVWEKGKLPVWLSLLYKSFLGDCYEKQKKRAEMTTSLTRETFNRGLKRLLQTPRPLITVGERRIDYHKEGDNRSLGFIPIDSPDFSNIHPDTIPLIKAGGEIFGSFMSHKLLHFENRLFYDRYRKKIHDFRKLVVNGGYEAILKKLGYSVNGRNINSIKKLFYFQSSFLFTLHNSDGGSKTGNLISLTENRNKFGKVGSLDIIAGSMLTPEAVYTASPEDNGNLLIPFVDLPEKMVGNPATWGSQAFLQMLLLEYITVHSREFAQKGAVLISKTEWEKLATEAKMTMAAIKNLPEIKEFFCDKDEGFLERQGDDYTINKRYPEANKHLLEQGRLREKKSKSAKKRKPKKK